MWTLFGLESAPQTSEALGHEMIYPLQLENGKNYLMTPQTFKSSTLHYVDRRPFPSHLDSFLVTL
jgi:hypothetical protein